MAFGWNLDPLTLPVAGQVDAFFHLFRLDLGDDEEGGLLTMMDKVRPNFLIKLFLFLTVDKNQTDGQPFQHPLLLKIVHRLIHTETLSPAASASKRSTLGTVSSVVFTRDSLIGVPNKTFAMILAQVSETLKLVWKSIDSTSIQIYLIGAAQLGQHPRYGALKLLYFILYLDIFYAAPYTRNPSSLKRWYQGWMLLKGLATNPPVKISRLWSLRKCSPSYRFLSNFRWLLWKSAYLVLPGLLTLSKGRECNYWNRCFSGGMWNVACSSALRTHPCIVSNELQRAYRRIACDSVCKQTMDLLCKDTHSYRVM